MLNHPVAVTVLPQLISSLSGSVNSTLFVSPRTDGKLEVKLFKGSSGGIAKTEKLSGYELRNPRQSTACKVKSNILLSSAESLGVKSGLGSR